MTKRPWDFPYAAFSNAKRHRWVNIFGVDNDLFCISETSYANRRVFQVVEDETDGYRSYLESIKEVDKSKGTFYRKPVARVKVVADEDNNLTFVDRSGHVWLSIGTNYDDAWYPRCYFTWEPKTVVQSPPKKKVIH